MDIIYAAYCRAAKRANSWRSCWKIIIKFNCYHHDLFVSVCARTQNAKDNNDELIDRQMSVPASQLLLARSVDRSIGRSVDQSHSQSVSQSISRFVLSASNLSISRMSMSSFNLFCPQEQIHFAIINCLLPFIIITICLNNEHSTIAI